MKIEHIRRQKGRKNEEKDRENEISERKMKNLRVCSKYQKAFLFLDLPTIGLGYLA